MISLFGSKKGGLSYEKYFAFAPLEVKFPNESTMVKVYSISLNKSKLHVNPIVRQCHFCLPLIQSQVRLVAETL